MILNNRNNKFLVIINLSIIIILLLVGLWPISFWPNNRVEWLQNKKGIRIGELGIIYTPETLRGLSPNSINNALTIEILLQPEREPDHQISHILTFYNSNKTENLIIAQWKSTLIISSTNIPFDKRNKYKQIGIGNALPKDISRFITISSGQKGTFIYIDGTLTKTFPNYTLTGKDMELPVQLILGNSSIGDNSWHGNITGLSMYSQQLSPNDVLKNYHAWTRKQYSQLSETSGLFSLYIFNERNARLLKDLSSYNNDLIIPETFKVFQKMVLETPWREWDKLQKIVSASSWKVLWISLSSTKDMAINIIGFIPYGFFFSLYLWHIKKIFNYRNYLYTILGGGGISLTIEILQVYTPTRSSSLSDLICNILGTALGVIIFCNSSARKTLK